MPLAALEKGVDWNWQTFGEYLDALDGRIAVNAGFMVGHCALRRYVMGADAVGSEATPEQLDADGARCSHEAMDAGGLGFSTTQSSHPLRRRRPAGRLPLADAATSSSPCARPSREHEGTTLEAIVDGCLDQFSDDEIDLLRRHDRRRRPAAQLERAHHRRRRARTRPAPARGRRRGRGERGGRIVALTMPILAPMNMSFGTFCALYLIPGWGEILGLPVPERIEKLRDPDVRAEMLRARRHQGGRRLPAPRRLRPLRHRRHLHRGERGPAAAGSSPTSPPSAARTPSPRLVEICANDDLRTVLWPMPTDNDAASLGAAPPRPGSDERRHARRLRRRRPPRPHVRRAVHRPASSATACAAASWCRWSGRCRC